MRSLLFVPGDRHERFAKALASGASKVCVDLEDGVGRANKLQARQRAAAVLRETNGGRCCVRINHPASRAGCEDLLCLADLGQRDIIVLVPKVESPGHLDIVTGVLEGLSPRLIPIVESVAGLGAAGQLAAHPNCSALLFGGGDFSAQLGVAMTWDALLMARSQIVSAAVHAGVASIDTPSLDLSGGEGLAQEAARARALGFSGKAAIHPAQIQPINSAFAPSCAEVEEAEAALAAFAASAGGAARFRGALLEAPVVRRYRRVLELAAEGAGIPSE